MRPVTFALYFGNRGFFPESLISGARREMKRVLAKLGYKVLLMDEKATPYGAVESAREGRKYAKWLAGKRGKYDGVILCLPNFGDETGAIAALEDWTTIVKMVPKVTKMRKESAPFSVN